MARRVNACEPLKWAFAVVVALASLLALPPRTLAQPTDDERARQFYLDGEDDYAAGRYEDAAKKFEKAYALAKRPALLFNLGNTYERMGEYQKAADALQEYLDSANPQRVKETQQRIRVLRKRAREKEVRDRELRKLRNQQSGNDGGDASDSGGRVTTSPSTPKGPSRLPSYLLIGGGGAALVAGVIFGVGANSAGNEAEGQCMAGAGGHTFCPASADDDLGRERSLSLAADISFGVGIAAAAAGVALLFVHGDDPTAVESGAGDSVDDGLSIGPTVVPGGGGLAVGGRF